MSDHYNKLKPREAELLALLAEEMGETIQVIGKILRHGYDSKHPNAPYGLDNRALLENEIGDVLAAVDLLLAAEDLDTAIIDAARSTKLARVRMYLHHQVESAP